MNIYNIDTLDSLQEQFSDLFKDEKINIKRIVSEGHASDPGFWYDQDDNEWVIVIEGEAELIFQNPEEKIFMKKGDYHFIPAHRQHRVSYTRKSPPTIWLAVHFK